MRLQENSSKCIHTLHNEEMGFFVDYVKTTERINMGLRPKDAKSSIDGRRLLWFFFGFRVPFPSILLINCHPYIFPLIKTKDIHITVAMETYVELLLIHFPCL